jgi:hypothetical protein
MRVFGHEFSTVLMDALASLLIIAFSYIVALFRLKRS